MNKIVSKLGMSENLFAIFFFIIHHTPTMKSFFIKYLLFSLLVFGTVMPVHAYVHSLHLTTSDQQQLSGDTDNQGDVQTAGCDHCCHFSSHTVGLHRSNHSDRFFDKGGILVATLFTYHSLKAGPPYHPPILA